MPKEPYAICPGCGKEVPLNATKCDRCGENLLKHAPLPDESKKISISDIFLSAGQIILLVGIVLLLKDVVLNLYNFEVFSALALFAITLVPIALFIAIGRVRELK